MHRTRPGVRLCDVAVSLDITVLPGGVADKGVDIPGRRDTQRYDVIRQDALRRPQSLCAQPGFLAGWAWGRAAGPAGGKVRIEERAPPS